ncbi:hypothetical protein B0H10DRAFT_2227179 [Mycena sp. CBHHK59/15]|nr:hypothetical protein B0H10DRAFT_2227179 [Mycena sp. CBHHK59/15]
MPALYSKRSTRLLFLSSKRHRITLHLLHRGGPSAPTPCLEARACIPAACRSHYAQSDYAQFQPLFDRLSSRVRRPPHDTPWQTDRSAAQLQRCTWTTHTSHSVSGKPISMTLNWE